MRVTLFLGCNIPARVPQYQDAAKAVCDKLGIELAFVEEFQCCGYPSRSIDEFAFLLSSARNLALAKREGNDLMVLCKCCFGSLKMAQHQLSTDKVLIEKVNQTLNREGLSYTDDVCVKHFLSILHEEIGIKTLKSHIQTKYKKLNIAASVGCHALRPAKVTQFDSPAVPAMFDDLVKLTGAKAVDWSKKSECCGAPLLGINDDLSRQIMETKLANALENSAHFIAVACPYSFLQFDRFQTRIARQHNNRPVLAPVLYPQLLGLAMGIDPERLGFSHHMADIDSLTSYLPPIEGETQEISHD